MAIPPTNAFVGILAIRFMKNSIIPIVLFMLILIVACSRIQQSQDNPKKVFSDDVSSLTPQQVVELYFQSWDKKEYGIMYSLISGGFKQIEPTARTLDDFQTYMDAIYDTSSGVKLIESTQTYQTANDSQVNYKIDIINKDGPKKEFKSTYTLKHRTNGWKLIHPYGDKIDNG